MVEERTASTAVSQTPKPKKKKKQSEGAAACEVGGGGGVLWGPHSKKFMRVPNQINFNSYPTK